MNTYSYRQTILKGIKYFVIFAIPLLVNSFVYQFPEIAQLTVGGLLVMLVNLLKVKFSFKII